MSFWLWIRKRLRSRAANVSPVSRNDTRGIRHAPSKSRLRESRVRACNARLARRAEGSERATQRGNPATADRVRPTPVRAWETSIGARATSIGARASSIGTKATSIGTKATSVGTRATSIGTRATSIGARSTRVGRIGLVRDWNQWAEDKFHYAGSCVRPGACSGSCAREIGADVPLDFTAEYFLDNMEP